MLLQLKKVDVLEALGQDLNKFPTIYPFLFVKSIFGGTYLDLKNPNKKIIFTQFFNIEERKVPSLFAF